MYYFMQFCVKKKIKNNTFWRVLWVSSMGSMYEKMTHFTLLYAVWDCKEK